MPADFDKCNREGGKIRTIELGDGKYIHVCYDKRGKSHRGEVRVKKEVGQTKGKKG